MEKTTRNTSQKWQQSWQRGDRVKTKTSRRKGYLDGIVVDVTETRLMILWRKWKEYAPRVGYAHRKPGCDFTAAGEPVEFISHGEQLYKGKKRFLCYG